MGLRGPAPLPTSIRVLEGNRSKRPLPTNEPQYTPGLPDQPPGMSRRARRYWEALITEMLPSGVLRRIDGFALGDLCESMAELRAYRRGAREEKIALIAADMNKRTVEGEPPPVPISWNLASLRWAASPEGRRIVMAMKDLNASILVQRREFGLTPASNCRVEALAPRPADVAGGGGPQLRPMDAIERAIG